MGVESKYIANRDKLGGSQGAMTCPLCQLVLVNPCQCLTCRQHFCMQCLRNYMASNQSKCPIDG